MALYAQDEIASTSVAADAEHWVLSTEAGRRLLAMAGSAATTPTDVERLRKLAAPEAVAAAFRIAAARAKGRSKFSSADALWLDPVGLEQATSEAVARHKARRFACDLAVDLCAGVGGDAIALAERCRVLAVDLSRDRCRRIAWNAGVLGLSDRILACRSRAESFPVPTGAWVHIDPDRRAGRHRRALAVADYAPSIEFLRHLVATTPAGALKLGPASDFAAAFPDPDVEIELTGLDGECKEATVWYGAAATCRRRATRLPEGATWTDLVETPFLAAFEVRSVHPLDLKQLKRAIAAEGLGPLEIKLRGLNLTPESLRARLRPPGPSPATLILAGGIGRARAIVARRMERSASPRFLPAASPIDRP
jgi:hypothetical protein